MWRHLTLNAQSSITQQPILRIQLTKVRYMEA